MTPKKKKKIEHSIIITIHNRNQTHQTNQLDPIHNSIPSDLRQRHNFTKMTPIFTGSNIVVGMGLISQLLGIGSFAHGFM